MSVVFRKLRKKFHHLRRRYYVSHSAQHAASQAKKPSAGPGLRLDFVPSVKRHASPVRHQVSLTFWWQDMEKVHIELGKTQK